MITINQAQIDVSNIAHNANQLTIPVVLTLNRSIPADKEIRTIVLQNLKQLIESLEGNLIYARMET